MQTQDLVFPAPAREQEAVDIASSRSHTEIMRIILEMRLTLRRQKQQRRSGINNSDTPSLMEYWQRLHESLPFLDTPLYMSRADTSRQLITAWAMVGEAIMAAYFDPDAANIKNAVFLGIFTDEEKSRLRFMEKWGGPLYEQSTLASLEALAAPECPVITLSGPAYAMTKALPYAVKNSALSPSRPITVHGYGSDCKDQL